MAHADAEHARYDLGVSSYDRVASALIALLILVGTLVAGLLILFFTSRIFTHQQAVPVTLANIASRPEDAALGFSRDLEPPGQEEVPELQEPQIQETLSAVASAASYQEAMLDDRALDGDAIPARGTGKGDHRRLGVGSEGIEERVPRAERWEIRFEASNLKSYARQLDYFGIELAAVGGRNELEYAFNLSKSKPERKVGSPTSEKRLYMTWRAGPLQDTDRQLLAKASIDASSRLIVQFYPAETENRLAILELEHADGRSVNDIVKTVFGVRRQADAYSFFVIDQKYF